MFLQFSTIFSNPHSQQGDDSMRPRSLSIPGKATNPWKSFSGPISGRWWSSLGIHYIQGPPILLRRWRIRWKGQSISHHQVEQWHRKTEEHGSLSDEQFLIHNVKLPISCGARCSLFHFFSVFRSMVEPGFRLEVFVKSRKICFTNYGHLLWGVYRRSWEGMVWHHLTFLSFANERSEWEATFHTASYAQWFSTAQSLQQRKIKTAFWSVAALWYSVAW